MRVVVALGGNALLRRGEALTTENQRRNVKSAARSIASLLRAGHRIIVTHGNGPQVGLLALQNDIARDGSAYPLDVLSAETVGMIGYLLEQEIANECGSGRPLATLLTRIEVDAHDPAFQKPTKPIGREYDAEDAQVLAKARHWTMGADGSKFRRFVSSPKPVRILEIDVIRLLADRGVTVICAGAGGIPVVRKADGRFEGIEAVIDKDAASALLAKLLRADALLLLTDVPGVFSDWGTPDQKLLREFDASNPQVASLPPGSMGAKVNAAIAFARTGRVAAIGTLDHALETLEGRAGTAVTA